MSPSLESESSRYPSREPNQKDPIIKDPYLTLSQLDLEYRKVAPKPIALYELSKRAIELGTRLYLGEEAIGPKTGERSKTDENSRA